MASEVCRHNVTPTVLLKSAAAPPTAAKPIESMALPCALDRLLRHLLVEGTKKRKFKACKPNQRAGSELDIR